jgi:AcrR family transcriptional regulator
VPVTLIEHSRADLVAYAERLEWLRNPEAQAAATSGWQPTRRSTASWARNTPASPRLAASHRGGPTLTTQPSRRVGRPPATLNGQTVPERLVEVALKLFAEKGFESTSVQDVVSAAGVTKGAMYHYFSSKDDLLAEVYTRVLRLQMERLDAFVQQDAPVDERIMGAAADVVVTTLEHLDSMTVFFRSLHQLSQDKQEDVRRERRRYHEAFRGMLLEGQRSGMFRDDVDANLIVDYFFGSVHHLPMWWKADRGLEAPDVGRAFASLLLEGLRRP